VEREGRAEERTGREGEGGGQLELVRFLCSFFLFSSPREIRREHSGLEKRQIAY